MAVRENIRDDVAATLEAAAGRLEARGWRQGGMGPREGPNCMTGALYQEVPDDAEWGEDGVYWQARYALDHYLHMSTSWWNDHCCPDAATAAEKLRLTAKEVANGNL